MQLLKSISEFAFWVRNVDPRMYDQFLTLLRQHVDEVTVAVTEAPAEEVRVMQGAAREARKVLQLFAEPREPRNPSA